MSQRFWEVKAAREFGKTPTEYWNLPEADQAYMLALVLTEGHMAAIEALAAEKAIEKATKKH